jgi:hypothetical protein
MWFRGPVKEKNKSKKAEARGAVHVDITVSGYCMRCWTACCHRFLDRAILTEKVTNFVFFDTQYYGPCLPQTAL